MNTADMKDMLTKMGGQRGQAGGMDAICKLFGASNLQGMMATLQSKGLGREVKSWVSNGQNTQVTGADIKKAADPAALRAMANEQGMSPDESAATSPRSCRTSSTRPRPTAWCRSRARTP